MKFNQVSISLPPIKIPPGLYRKDPMEVNYGVATISRLLKIIGLCCKRALRKRLYSAQETYNLKEPTNRNHPIDSVSAQHSSMSRLWGGYD